MVALSIGLPSGIFAFQDKNIINKVNLVPQEVTQVNNQQRLSVLKKIELYEKSSFNSLAIDEGKYFNKQSVKKAASQELKILKELGVFPDIGDEIYIQDCIAKLYVSTEHPSESFIIWTMVFYNQKGTGTISLDDETGKILMFSINKVNGIPLYELSLKSAKAWGNYLGFTVKESYIKLTNKKSNYKKYYKQYYQVVIYQDKNNTLMYGIMKYSSGYNYGVPPEGNNLNYDKNMQN